MAFVPMFEKSTGRRRMVPEHWVDHPVIGKQFRKTPPQQVRRQVVAVEEPVAVDNNTDKAPASGDNEGA